MASGSAGKHHFQHARYVIWLPMNDTSRPRTAGESRDGAVAKRRWSPACESQALSCASIRSKTMGSTYSTRRARGQGAMTSWNAPGRARTRTMYFRRGVQSPSADEAASGVVDGQVARVDNGQDVRARGETLPAA